MVCDFIFSKKYLQMHLYCSFFLLLLIQNTYGNYYDDIRYQHNGNQINLDYGEYYYVERTNPFFDWLASIIRNPPPTEVPSTPEAPLPTAQHGSCYNQCKCGVANKANRIVGGQETEVNHYPWMAMLRYGTKFYCGATLINDRYVLTAAHCVNGFNPNNIVVRLLEHNRSIESSNKIDRKVLRIIRHASYSSSNYNNDIALIRLDKPIEIKGLLRPVCLPTPGKSFTNQTGIVTGWGAKKQGGPTSETLQEVGVPILSNAECRRTAYGSTRITNNMLCAGHKIGQKDSCQGDSGGPLHVINNSEYQVAGIVSWGEGCAKPNYPGVYTRVNRYGTWIRSNTRDACYC